MILIYRRLSAGIAAAFLVAVCSCGTSSFDSSEVKERIEQLKKTSSFQYPLDDYFPEVPVTASSPPRGESHHTGEDSFSPPGTPVHAIGDGVIRYSGEMSGYGWLIIIDHPVQQVYSLYGHLSSSRWKKSSGEVKKGELIAYLGEAEEGETMVSHIHFGMRIGQKADYWRWGDGRWMAGYTRLRPDSLGWLHPSEIIGETGAMRDWKRSIQKRDDVISGRILKIDDFRVTSGKYNEKKDLDQMIQIEFGDQYRLADWNDIMTFRDNIEEWADSLGLTEGEENSWLISNDGYRIWLGRQYYISRFDHKKPKNFLAHDSMDNNCVCLGSWFGLNKHALAVRK